MKLKELGEFALIEILGHLLERERAGIVGRHPVPKAQVLAGIGEDAAVWQEGATLYMATTDTLVEGVHFLSSKATWREIGGKALAVSLSDIAAMGGVPRYALVNLALPEEMEVEGVAELYLGIAQVARRFDTLVIGGDTVSSPVPTIAITIIGEAMRELPSPHFLSRYNARSGEAVAVTGFLGASAGGLQVLLGREARPEGEPALLRLAHFYPEPRITEGQLLVRHGVHAAIDLCDGLLSDLRKLCKASGVGATVWVDKVPISSSLAKAFPNEALELALSGGEDYELLCTAPLPVVEGIKKVCPTPVTVIGEIHSGEAITLLDKQGKKVPWEKEGWEHFKARPGVPHPPKHQP